MSLLSQKIRGKEGKRELGIAFSTRNNPKQGLKKEKIDEKNKFK